MTVGTTAEEGIGEYQPGLLKRSEAVVSAHFMHLQNLAAGELYSSVKFHAETIYITPDDAEQKLIPMLRKASEKVVEKRSEAACQRARRNYAQFGLSDPSQTGIAECITEVLLDDWFRKGHVSAEDKIRLRDQIADTIGRNGSIRMVIPMLPNKVASPLKVRGTLPCMAEAGVLSRLGEITACVDKIRQAGSIHQAQDIPKTQFIIVCDGRRFRLSLKTPESVIKQYQTGLNWWIQQLGINQSVQLTDYEYILDKNLSTKDKADREKYYNDAFGIIDRAIGLHILDPMNVEQSLQKAMKDDPYSEVDNPEGRFVPLFRSMMYNVQYGILSQISNSKMLGEEEFNRVYRELTRHLFEPYATLDANDIPSIEKYMKGEKTNTTLTILQIKEYVRRAMLQEAWESSMHYLACVVADRALAVDPISQAVPDAIRYSIHSKPGQIGLATDSAISSPVQAWHGSGVLRPSGMSVKLSNDSCLHLETNGARPILVRLDKTQSYDPSDLMHQFAQSQQPLMYVDPTVKLDLLSQQFTHCR